VPGSPPIAFFDILTENLDAFASGFWVTVKIVAISFVIAMGVGTLVAAFRVAPSKWLQRAGGLYVECFRNIPLLVLLFISFPGLRRAGVEISAMVAGVASLGLYTAAYVAEALRSGVFSVSKGQIEAALSLGFTYPETLRRIVLPQAFRTVISPLGSLIIAMIKNSAILGGSILALDDLLKTGRIIASRSFEVIPSFVWAASGYLILTGLATIAIRRLEIRYAIRR
jgi:His/Glu/Gln/Arg/opine family amino acid ABC transporter permease subunit